MLTLEPDKYTLCPDCYDKCYRFDRWCTKCAINEAKEILKRVDANLIYLNPKIDKTH